MNSEGVEGAPGAGDHLGAAIDLSDGTFGTGLQGRRVNGRSQAGAVLVGGRDDQSPYLFQLLTQDTAGFAGKAETGDRFGSALAGGWIGVPGEEVRGVRDAGLLQSLKGGAFHQGTAGTPGSPRAGDQPGAALGVRVAPTGNSHQALRILAGLPGEDVAGVKDAGPCCPSDTPPTASRPSPTSWSRLHPTCSRAPGSAPPCSAVSGPRSAGAARANGYGTAPGGIPNLT